MTESEIYTNANLISLRAQVDALIFSMDENVKDKYQKRLVDSLANIYETFESQISTEDFKKTKVLAEAMVFRN